jgi:hypothetical protein
VVNLPGAFPFRGFSQPPAIEQAVKTFA